MLEGLLRAFLLPSRWKSNASQHSGDLAVFVWFLLFAAKWCWLFRWRKLCNYFFHLFFSQAVTRFSPWWPTSSYCINNLPITHTVLFCKMCFFSFFLFFFKGRKNLKTQEHERAGVMLVLLWQDKMEYKTVLASIMWLHIQSSSLYINYVRPVFWGKAEAHRGRGNPRYWFSARCAIPSCLDTSGHFRWLKEITLKRWKSNLFSLWEMFAPRIRIINK